MNGDGRGWRKLTRITNDELGNFVVMFKGTNRDVASLISFINGFCRSRNAFSVDLEAQHSKILF